MTFQIFAVLRGGTINQDSASCYLDYAKSYTKSFKMAIGKGFDDL